MDWVELKADQKWLYYETGFEQLHPIPYIHSWMEDQGLKYYKDWNVLRRGQEYFFQFPNENIKLLFLLRWSGIIA
jgi:hypothetical protein